MPTNPKPAILMITSDVVRGSVGGRAASFAVQRLGFPLWTVHTVTLPWHPGHGPSRRIVPDPEAFEALIEDLSRAPWLGEIGGVLTGYMGNAAQPALVARLIDRLRAIRPGLLYLCDPVMGDNGRLYVPEATAAAIRDHLVPRADVLTPNLTELAFLAGHPLESRAAILAASRALPAPRVAVTSAFRDGESTETLFTTPSGLIAARQSLVGGRPPNGPGDLFAGLLLARLLGGMSDRDALRLATATVADMLALAGRLGTDELPFAAGEAFIAAPESVVTIAEAAEEAA